MKHKFLQFIVVAAVAILASCGNDPEITLPKAESYDESNGLYSKESKLIVKAVKAQELFYAKNSRASKEGASVSHYVVCESRADADTVLSVVNFADNGGFVILTDKADSPEILAVSDDGHLDVGNIDNPALKSFVNGAVAALSGRSKGDTPLDPTRPFLYEIEHTYDTVYNVAPMIKVQWGQSVPYNNFTPRIGIRKTPVGCAPIAAAQIMTHYRHPNYFLWDVDDNPRTIILDWDDINRHVSSGTLTSLNNGFDNTVTTHETIGRLVCELGKKMNTEYEIGDASTSFGGLKSALEGYGYTVSPVTRFIDSKKTTFDGSSIWILLGHAEDEDGIPYNHFFVVDGRKYIRYHRYSYIADPSYTPPMIIEVVENTYGYYDYIHINWGWDGSSNGYFYNGTYNSANPHSLDVPDAKKGTYNFTEVLSYIKVSR